MEDNLYEAARGEDTIPSSSDVDFILHRTLDEDCNVLHIAAQYGNNVFMGKVGDQFPRHFDDLLCQQNSKGETPLHLAAQSGDMNTVELLLNAHDGIYAQGEPCWNMCDKNGDTPLHRALRYGHDDISVLLLEKNRGLISHCNHLHESPAYLAAYNFCFKFLRTTLDAVCDAKNNDSFSGPLGQTVLHPARKLTGDVMSILIEKRRDKLTVQDIKGKTVLHYAVEEQRESIVKMLLKAKSSLAFLRDVDSLTPLHRAAKMGLYSMVLIILKLSPQSIFIRTSEGQTALHVAKMDDPSFAGCIRNTRIKELINVADNEGNTPLHLASKSSNLDIVDALLEVGGVNWRLRNKDGYTPMDLFSSKDKFPRKLHLLESVWKEKEVINISIFHNENVKNLEDLLNSHSWEDLNTYRGHKENTIFHIAARNGCEEIINRAHESSSSGLLLLSGENSKGETPLHMAAEYGQSKVVKLILKRSLSTDRSGNQMVIRVDNGHDNYADAHIKPWRMKSTNGDTPLHKAVRNGHAKVALRLLRCDPGLAAYVNEANESVLYLAAQSQSYHVIQEILGQNKRYTYCINGPDGKNPLHAYVISSGSPYTVYTKIKGDSRTSFDMIKGLPDVLNKIDNVGKTPLHYAVEVNNHLMVKELLQHDKSAAFVYDNEGFTPILRAASNSFHDCVGSILNKCPHSAELRDVINNGTTLHLFKKSPTYYLLPHSWKKRSYLFNETDMDGNTTLHRAIWEGKIDWAKQLVGGGANIWVRNNKQQTPLDLCLESIRNGDLSPARRYDSIKLLQGWNKTPTLLYMLGRIGSPGRHIEGMKEKELKQLVNNMVLIATLLVTLTFAAAFTVPGGYDQTTGQLLRIKQPSVHMFLTFDVLAMLLGMTALLTYAYAFSGNHSLMTAAVWGNTFFMYSLYATIVAFAFGISALASNDRIGMLSMYAILSYFFVALFFLTPLYRLMSDKEVA